MDSVAVNVAINNDNRDTLLNSSDSPTRPNLSIDTNIKKKKWNSIFSAKDKIKFDLSPTKESKKRPSLPTPPNTHTGEYTESPSISSHDSLERLDTLTSVSSSEEQKPKSVYCESCNTTHSGVQSVLKLFHLPKRMNSASTVDQDSEATCNYTPVAPEPIMPALINWSPDAPLSPPPWELQQQQQSEPIHHTQNKRHSTGYNSVYTSVSFYDEAEVESITTLDSAIALDYHSDSEIGNYNTRHKSNLSPSSSIGRISDVTLTDSTLSPGEISAASSQHRWLRRRSSCPAFDTLSINSTSTSSSATLVDNDIISITEQHTRHTPAFKRYTHPADKKPAFKVCQKAKVAAAEAAANGNSIQLNNPFFSTLCEESLKYLYIPNVFHPETREPVLEFSTIKPRKYELHRKTSWKKEAKAMMTWHHTLEENIRKVPKIESPIAMSSDKLERYTLNRRFILREFFVTEVNFWNQLYYSKVIFYDAIVAALENGSQFVKESDIDPFANLFDLMQFSAKLINRLRHFQLSDKKRFGSPIIPSALHEDLNPQINCNNNHLGKTICEMAEDFVVFLRCAVDYKENRKILDSNVNNKGYMKYRQKLSSKKETSQFEMSDYLIIPIQRVARYGLLIADLIKHSDPNSSDYKNLVQAYHIVTSLATAMNAVQGKRKIRAA